MTNCRSRQCRLQECCQDNLTLPQLRDTFYLQDISVYASQYSETMDIVRKTFDVIESISTNVVTNEENHKGMNIFSFINSIWKYGVFIFMLIASTILVGIPAYLLYKLCGKKFCSYIQFVTKRYIINHA